MGIEFMVLGGAVVVVLGLALAYLIGRTRAERKCADRIMTINNSLMTLFELQGKMVDAQIDVLVEFRTMQHVIGRIHSVVVGYGIPGGVVDSGVSGGTDAGPGMGVQEGS